MISYFHLFCYFLDDEKCCKNCVDPGTKGSKTAKIVSTGQNWAQLDKEYLHADWNSDTKIWMEGGQGGDLSARKMIFLTKLTTIKQRLRKCPQIPTLILIQ